MKLRLSANGFSKGCINLPELTRTAYLCPKQYLCRVGLGALEGHRALLHIRIDGEQIAGGNFAVEQLHGQGALNEPLDGALERTRPIPQAKGAHPAKITGAS